MKAAVDKVLTLPTFQPFTLQVVVEWASQPKLINYRFHAENKTHSIAVVTQYLTESQEFTVVSEEVKEKRASAPKLVEVPYSSDSVVEEEGEES